MKKVAVVLVFLLGLMTGCGDNAPSATEPSEGSSATSQARSPTWKLDYTGDLNGSVQGSILNVQTMIPGTIVVAGGALSPDRTQAAERISASILTSGNDPTATVKLTLADGTKCRSADAAQVRELDENKETFRAQMSGKLVCDGSKAITFDATLRAKT